MLLDRLPIPGLTDDAVAHSRAEHGRNILPAEARSGVWATLKEVVSEPMFLLLLAACAVYIGLKQLEEAITLAIALVLVSAISIYQSIRSDRALNALRELTQPRVQVRRNGQVVVIAVADLVVGDAVLTEEGERVPGADTLVTGQQIMAMDEPTLRQQTKQTAVFARMFPEAELRVVNALKATGEIVAMTGDGVNDGPALKAAHIGVAMGQRGTEVARQAASLVLVNDDLNSMVEAIAQGRRIYQNLKKAIAYIVSTHIPIILTVAVPLLASWKWENLFSPIHVIFLELVMGPTCSIAFENEPAEPGRTRPGQMQQPPRRATDTFLAGRELGRSLWRGRCWACTT